MQVSVLYFAECPNWADAGQRIRTALDTIGLYEVEVRFRTVETVEEATAVGFGGSPTFLVDDADLFGPPASAGALTCRVYPTEHGLSGVPTLVDLVAKLKERTGR